MSGLSVGAADRPSVSHYDEEPRDEVLAVARGLLRAGILSAGAWLVIGAVIYWLT